MVVKARRWSWRILQIATVLTLVVNVIAFSQGPFVEPWVVRTKAEALVALDRAIVGQLTPEWVGAELDAAVDDEDLARTELLLELVEREEVPVLGLQIDKARSYVDREAGLVARLVMCSSCFADPVDCKTPSVFLVCNLPIELTVIGDARVLAEAGADAVAGDSVDRIGVALATVGIGASALAPLTGGTSYSIKLGSTAVRVARRMGVLGNGLSRALSKASDIPFRWNNVDEFVNTGNLDVVTDSRLLRELADIVGDLGTVGRNAHPKDTVFLLRHVENVEDVAGLAQVSKVAGKRTREAVEVLGLQRATKAIKRLSDLAMLTIGLLCALVGQILALATPVSLRLLRRVVQPDRG
ncbi:MAG: hypothetical protein J4G15_06350 [Alphaproteobacteria bacterium]|nr:hypothetical protein [Alphaproteobacteria bacterium]